MQTEKKGEKRNLKVQFSSASELTGNDKRCKLRNEREKKAFKDTVQ